MLSDGCLQLLLEVVQAQAVMLWGAKQSSIVLSFLYVGTYNAADVHPTGTVDGQSILTQVISVRRREYTFDSETIGTTHFVPL